MKNKISEKHARLSPSNFRWVYCPGSIREEAKYPDIPSPSAIDGTGSHLLLETCLKKNIQVNKMLGKIIGIDHPYKPSGWKIKEDRIKRVQTAINYVEQRKKELIKEYPGCRIEVETESKSDPGKFFNRSDWWGTADITFKVFQNKELKMVEVIDYKDGDIWVPVKNNPQLTAYLFGKTANQSLNIFNCRVTIIQPKTSIPKRHQDINSKILENNIYKLFEAVKKTDNPDAKLIPDNKKGKGYCRWCKHKNNCEARAYQILGGLKMFMEEIGGKSLQEAVEDTLKNIETMDAVKLSEILNAKDTLNGVFKRVEEEATKRLKNGDIIPGYSMQPGRSEMKWKISEEELIKKLRACKFKKEQIYTTKLITPSQILNHSDLTDRQKERIKSNYIVAIPGSLKLKTSKHADEKKEVVDMFEDVVLHCNTNQKEISFI